MSAPPSDARLRIWRSLGLLLGAIMLFIWLPIEDLSAAWTVWFAIAISSLAAWRILYRFQQTCVRQWLLYAGTGLLAGAAVSPLAVVLMALKTGLHGHNLPDFTPAQVLSVIWRTPWWTFGGLLVGLGSALWRQTRRTSGPE